MGDEGWFMEDESTPQDSLLPYDVWMEESLRYVVMRALTFAASNELPGKHHYYITFRTDFPGVVMPQRLREKYPQEMTIVLQHQFRDLNVDVAGRVFGVTLSFGGIASPLTVPLDAVSAFVDPSIQYGLRFKVEMPEIVPEPETRPEPVTAPPVAAGEAGPQVVSLDAFRKRRE